VKASGFGPVAPDDVLYESILLDEYEILLE
jgi:hypothetical protein